MRPGSSFDVLLMQGIWELATCSSCSPRNKQKSGCLRRSERLPNAIKRVSSPKDRKKLMPSSKRSPPSLPHPNVSGELSSRKHVFSGIFIAEKNWAEPLDFLAFYIVLF